MQCVIMENTLIKLTLHDETKKRAHDSQIVRAKEILKLSHGGSSYLFGLKSGHGRTAADGEAVLFLNHCGCADLSQTEDSFSHVVAYIIFYAALKCSCAALSLKSEHTISRQSCITFSIRCMHTQILKVHFMLH